MRYLIGAVRKEVRRESMARESHFGQMVGEASKERRSGGVGEVMGRVEEGITASTEA